MRFATELVFTSGLKCGVGSRCQIILSRDPAITEAIQNLLVASPIVILFGVGGSGKSALLAGMAQVDYQSGHPVCWIGVSPITEMSDIQKILSSSLHYFGKTNAAQIVSAECRSDADYVDKIIYALENCEIDVFVDSTNSGGKQIEHLLKRVIEGCTRQPLRGRLVLSTTDLSPFSRTLGYVTRDVAASYLMPALDSDEFSRILGEEVEQFGEEELEELRMAVGGHYLSTVFLCNILRSGKHLNLRDLKEEGSASAQKWLVGEIIRNLGNEERTVLSCVSIFDYKFDLDEVQSVVEEQVFSPFVCLNVLCDVGVVRFDGAGYYVHETVQPLVYTTLAENTRKRVHERAQKHYRKYLEERGDEEKGYPSDLITKWGRHVERLSECGVYVGRAKEIIGLSNEQIDAIWSIQRFGLTIQFCR